MMALCLVPTLQYTTYAYKTIGNLSLLADVYLPPQSSYCKYPVVFVIHGGGYVFGTRSGAPSEQENVDILSRGWAIVTIDYRLSPEALLDEILDDVQDAYDWVRGDLASRVPIDPEHIVLFGGSAGGGLTVIGGFRLTPRPKVVISFYPFYANFTDPAAYNPAIPLLDAYVAETDSLRQLISGYNATGYTDPRFLFFINSLLQQKYGWLLTTTNPNEPADEIIKKLISLSAVYNVDENYPPTYLAHGLADFVVSYRQSQEMAAQLALKNITYQLDLIPGAGHGFDASVLDSDFYDKHVRPAFDFAQQHMMAH